MSFAARYAAAVLDERVRAVLARLEREDAEERERGLAPRQRSRQIARAAGQFLFALVAPQHECGVLEIGGSRGYSTLWLATGVRLFSGYVVSLEHDPAKAEAWRRNVSEAGLDEWAGLVEGNAFETIAGVDDVFDLVFLDAEKDDYERLFELARARLEPGAVIVADNVLSHEDTLGAYSRRPPGRPDARVAHDSPRPRPRALGPPALVRGRYTGATAERRWSGSDRFQYGQWRYQRVEVRPRDLRGIAQPA